MRPTSSGVAHGSLVSSNHSTACSPAGGCGSHTRTRLSDKEDGTDSSNAQRGLEISTWATPNCNDAHRSLRGGCVFKLAGARLAPRLVKGTSRWNMPRIAMAIFPKLDHSSY